MRQISLIAASIISLGVLAGCEMTTLPERGAIVPGAEMLTRLQRAEQECLEYDAGTDSCGIAIRYSRAGREYRATAQMLVEDQSDALMQIVTPVILERDLICLRFSDMEVSFPNLGEFMNEMLNAELEGSMDGFLAEVGAIACSRYTEAGPGQYILDTIHPVTREVVESDVSWLFNDAKPLRYEE